MTAFPPSPDLPYAGLTPDAVLDALDAAGASVVAAPGGVVLDPAVRQALDGAFVVWLRADPTVLARRVRPGDHRPLLGDDPEGVLTSMAADRAELYAGVADVVIDIDQLDPDQVAERVLAHYVRRDHPPTDPHPVEDT